MDALAAEEELRALLTRRGVELRVENATFVGAGRDAPAAWRAFKDMAAMPVDDVDVTSDGDMLLFATWVAERQSLDESADADEPIAFAMDFTRQFSFEDENGEYAGMEGLRLTLEFPPLPDLAELDRAEVWGCAGPPWTDEHWRRRDEEPRPFAAAQDWIEEVERSEPFTVAFAASPATGFSFRQSPY